MPLRTSNGVVFTVLAPEPALRTGIEVRVYDRLSPATLLDVLPRTRARRWLDQLNDPGSGSFEIAEGDAKLKANPNLLTYGNLVRFYLDGVVRFAFVIEHVERTKASEGEDAERWLKVSGRGALALLEGALVYLAAGLTGSAQRAFTAQKAGAIMSTLVTEAQVRGGLEGVTLGFTATADSLGAPFEDTLDLSERAGSDLLQVAQRHAELAVDVAMRPTLVLDYFNTRGIDRSIQTPNAAPVVLRIAHNVGEASFASEGVIKNTLLIEGPAGWQERQDAGSVTTYGRREAYLSLGTAGTADQIGRSADAALRENAKPRDAITLRVEDLDGHRPYVDFDVGDFVLAPSPAGALTKYRVRAISVSEDADGRPVFVPELSTLQRELEERFQRWLKAMSNGTLGGYAAEIASPSVDAAAVDEKVDQHAATVLHPDELPDLLDVETTGVTDGQVLTYSSAQARWQPATPAAAAIVPVMLPFMLDGADVTWTNQPAAETEFLGVTRHRIRNDLTNVTQVRFIGHVRVVGAAGAQLRVQYSIDGLAWSYLDGATGPAIAIDTSGIKETGWVAVVAGARQLVHLRIVGINGNAVADPAFSNIYLLVRP